MIVVWMLIALILLVVTVNATIILAQLYAPVSIRERKRLRERARGSPQAERYVLMLERGWKSRYLPYALFCRASAHVTDLLSKQ